MFETDPALQFVDMIMHAGDGQRGIDAAMIVHDQSVLGAAHAHGVDVLDLADLFGASRRGRARSAPRSPDFLRTSR